MSGAFSVNAYSMRAAWPIVCLSVGFSGCAAVTATPRFKELCSTTAGFSMERRPQPVQGVLIDYSGARGPYYRYAVPPAPHHLLQFANVEHVDQLTETGTRYRRYSGNGFGPPEILVDSDAQVLLTMREISTDKDRQLGIQGNELRLVERQSGKTISAFRYFWRMSPYEVCPTGKDPQGPHTTHIAAYMLGLRDASKESVYREWWIP